MDFRRCVMTCLGVGLCVLQTSIVYSGVNFEQEIRPVLLSHCSSCHGVNKQKALLRLDLRADALKGGENGPVIVPGKPAESELIRRICSDDEDEVMPPLKKGQGRLSKAQIASLTQWIAEGAIWPEDGSVADTFALAKGHWAFSPPIAAEVPQGEHPIDFFVSAKHRELGLQPAPEADRATLLRRVTLDLTGLPPTPDELSAFLADADPEAYDKVVTRLLASESYGIRWGRFWLDLARWAQSDGFEANEYRSSAWRYRDYVVQAFNEDRPYDRFLREQIAGDELEPYSDENLIATGFLSAARNNNNEEDKVVQLNEPIVDIANTTAVVTLGLTLGCAQCHDHKFEALTIRDYYSWHGFFLRGQCNTLLLQDSKLVSGWENSRDTELDEQKLALAALTDPVRKRLRDAALAQLTEADEIAMGLQSSARTPEQQTLADLAKQALEITDEEVLQALAPEALTQLNTIKQKIEELDKQRTAARPQTWGYYSPATSPHHVENLPPRGQYPFPYDPDSLKIAPLAVLKRGSVAMRGDPVESAIPTILGGTQFTTRREFAEWLASDANPLTARVWANYVWQQHFGRGLVETPGDFGVKGARPTNQPLLDWLACELRSHQWSTKHLHRLIVTSAAFRRSTHLAAGNKERDPENRYLASWRPRRLESEVIRDSMLAVAGRLDISVGGPSDESDKPSDRRSLYLSQRRMNLPETQALFDAPVANEACMRRHISTVPLQPLHLLNQESNRQLAADFAVRVTQVAGTDRAQQITVTFQIAFCRDPDETERELAKAYLAEQSVSRPDAADAVLADFCQAVLNLNEFVYLP